jgi:hypothetical protein
MKMLFVSCIIISFINFRKNDSKNIIKILKFSIIIFGFSRFMFFVSLLLTDVFIDLIIQPDQKYDVQLNQKIDVECLIISWYFGLFHGTFVAMYGFG